MIIADDLTGALDTGVPFANNGLSVRVYLSPQVKDGFDEACDVLIACTRSRHVPARQALDLVRDAFAAQSGRFSCYFKKLDSTLRGNLGAELEGMAMALTPCRIHLLNAFPAAGRTTVGGKQYLQGVPLDQTAFARDPFNPVQSVDILETIKSQSGLFRVHPEFVKIYDAQTDDDIMRVIESLNAHGELRTLAGCAGLAAGLAQLWQKTPTERREWRLHGSPLTLCGSINPIVTTQVAYAREHGMRVETLPDSFLRGDKQQELVDARRLSELHKRQPLIILTPRPAPQPEIASRDGVRMAQAMGRLYAALLQTGFEAPMLIVGGDTLEACVDAIGCRSLVPRGEPLPGTVLFELDVHGSVYRLLSRAGGFGAPSALVDLFALMKGGIS